MAFTRMAKAIATANTLTTLYTVPTANSASTTLTICNGSDVAVEVDVAVSALATPTAAEYTHKGLPLAAGETKDVTLIVVGDELVVVKTTASGVSFRLAGTLI